MSVVAALATIAMIWNKHTSVDEWISKMSVNAAIYYLTIKQNKVLLQHGRTTEDTILAKEARHKRLHIMSPFI